MRLFIVTALAILALAGYVLSFPFSEALSHDHPMTAMEQWAVKQQVMPGAKARFNCAPDSTCSCCNGAEIVKTQFRVGKKDGRDQWWYKSLITGQWRQIPDDIIHPQEEETPTLEPVLFLYPVGTDTPRCFFTGSSGG